jgi:hypothetical protein
MDNQDKKESTPRLEKEIQAEILDYLDKGNFLFWRSNNVPVFAKNNAGKYMYRSLPKYTPRGLPDIIVIASGKFIAIEVKRKGAKLRPEQAEFGVRVIKEGGTYIVATCLEDLKQVPEFMPPC